jgi:hypothetical protein
MSLQVAASSFNMEVTNPRKYLDAIDRDRCGRAIDHQRVGK